MIVGSVETGTLGMEHEGKWGKPKKKQNGIFRARRQGSFSASSLSPIEGLDKNLICWPTRYSMEHGK